MADSNSIIRFHPRTRGQSHTPTETPESDEQHPRSIVDIQEARLRRQAGTLSPDIQQTVMYYLLGKLVEERPYLTAPNEEPPRV